MTTSPTDNLLTDTAPWRDGAVMRSLLDEIARRATRPWRIMEVCGGQTFTLSRYRLEELLPAGIQMIHGPGCPVCVTPEETIDAAIEIAMRPEVTLCSFGDMMRVPGSQGSLLRAKAAGADVRILYSPLDALELARREPGRQVVFLAIGFETTTPHYALLVEKAQQLGIDNLSLITSLRLVPPVVTAIATDPDCRVDGLLAAGHVCAITGLAPYRELAERLRMPITVTGFEPADLLLGLLRTVEMLERGEAEVVNAYGRVVGEQGNPSAQARVARVFEPAATAWRGIGTIAQSGMELRPAYEHFDARRRFNVNPCGNRSRACRCIAARIMKGQALPADCPCFGSECTPQSPVGAPMVSSEGVCAAHYRYNR